MSLEEPVLGGVGAARTGAPTEERRQQAGLQLPGDLLVALEAGLDGDADVALQHRRQGAGRAGEESLEEVRHDDLHRR